VANTFETDEIICRSEIEEMNIQKNRKDEIIRTAAIKLENSGKYDGKLDEICPRIQKLWGWISKSHISNILDDKYKREYSKKESDIIDSLLDEILWTTDEILQGFSKVVNAIRKKSRSDPNIKSQIEESLMNSIHDIHSSNFIPDLQKQMSKIGQLQSLLNYLKKELVNMEYMQDCVDWREKLDNFMKIRLRMIFVERHFSDVAKTLHISSKWASKIGRDPKILAFIESCQNCPKCQFNIGEYYNKSIIAQEKGIEIDSLTVPEIKCDCEK
jgi:hypothetical protein